MNRLLSALPVFAILGTPISADTLGQTLKKGLDNTTQAIGEGAKKVGDVIDKGAKAVGDTVDSTTELFSNEPTPDETRAKLDAIADTVLAQLLAENAKAAAAFESAAGYAVFDTRQVTIFPLTAGFGRGVARSKSGDQPVYMQMGTGGVGAAFGIGGFASQFVIMFETEADLTKFEKHGYDASAEAGAMSDDGRDQETVRFTDGRSFFVLDKNGWRLNANATGTKYWRDPDLN